MGISTPEQFAKKLVRMADAVQHSQDHALRARADITKDFILVEAARVAPRQVRPTWVRTKIADQTAEVRLKGGFAKLWELGSYHQQEPYVEKAKKVTARRRKNALAKGVTLNESGLMRTPYGALPFVHHPLIRPRPFFKQGLDRARKPGHVAYEKSINKTITDALK